MYENKAQRQLGTVIGVIALIFMVVPSIFIGFGNSFRCRIYYPPIAEKLLCEKIREFPRDFLGILKGNLRNHRISW